MTKLDKILNEIGEDGDLSPYFMALLDVTLIVPRDTSDAEDYDDGESEEENDDAMNPVVLESDDQQYIPVFDSVERFKKWATDSGESISYVEVPGYAFFDALEVHDDLHVVVNHTFESEELLYPEHLMWIQENAPKKA